MKLFYSSFLVLVLSTKCLKSQKMEDSAWFKCTATSASNVNIANPISVCSAKLDNFTNCVQKNSQGSLGVIDNTIYKNVNLHNFDKAKNYLCSQKDILNKADLTCMSELDTCFENMDKMMLRCFDIIPCIYKVVNACSPLGAIIFSKTLTILKSIPCTLTSYHYKLSPFYGPEIECYPKLQKPLGTAAAKLGNTYEYFCKNFQKEKVSHCIEHNVIEKKSILNLDDHYINNAKEFFRDRSELCEHFSQPSIKTCPDVDVLSCQEDLFKTDANSKFFDVLQRNYHACVYDKYKSCDVSLANVIQHNLVGGHKSQAAHLWSSSVLLAAYLAVIVFFLN